MANLVDVAEVAETQRWQQCRGSWLRPGSWSQVEDRLPTVCPSQRLPTVCPSRGDYQPFVFHRETTNHLSFTGRLPTVCLFTGMKLIIWVDYWMPWALKTIKHQLRLHKATNAITGINTLSINYNTPNAIRFNNYRLPWVPKTKTIHSLEYMSI